MLPGYYVHLEAFPLTPSAKVDHKALPEPEFKGNDEYVAPETKEEKLLCEIWSKVLGIEKIGITDNFFSIGGDSIKSIQVSSKMRIEGYNVSVRDIFTYKTIEALAPNLEEIKTIANQSLVTGEVPLTGIQQWFFSSSMRSKHHFNQSVMLNFPERVTEEQIRRIFTHIHTHHDALRMTYRWDEGKVIQQNHDLSYPLSLVVNDLRGNPASKEELLKLCNELQASIDLEMGPLMKLGLFDMQDGTRLLIVIHHLVIDGISWRILFDDVEMLYAQEKSGEELQLPLKTDSFQLWSSKLLDYRSSKSYQEAIEYWNKILDKEQVIFKKNYSEDQNTTHDTSRAGFRLSKSTTDKLLGEVHEAFNTQINDILLAGLLMSVNKYFGSGALQIHLEGHGREQIIEDIDIGRTIGWFTSLYPVVLEESGEELSELIKSVKESLRNIPNNGIDYLIGRYLFSDIKPVNNSQVIFNYLGQFDSDTMERAFEIASEPTGDAIMRGDYREYELEFVGMVSEGRLGMNVTYNIKQYNEEVVNALMSLYQESLVELVDYCVNREAQELTPSDFSYKGLTLGQLDELKNKLMNDEY
ncbi:Long-chain-fatty-acid--CoA ligase [Fulvivirga imtechensis AK7]|uniref:Long-chain-fatty-acid--CoA ligase n=2 Tax=Fulvivirga TaxID=396811 RepID=L8JKG2_9BACT|nr:Long-chain-fatty-acid--CoA ligase [Fulvivirga imtechensis AK7]